MHRQSFGKPARHPLVCQIDHIHMAQLMPQRARPVKAPRRAARGTIHRHHTVKRHTQRAQTRHTHRAHRKIFMIRIHLNLHRHLHLVLILLLVRRHRLVQFSLNEWQQHIRFLRIELDHRGRRAKRLEPAVAVHQGQRIHRRFVAVVILVSQFQLSARFCFPRQPHQIHAQLRMRTPQIRRRRNRFPVVSKPVFIPAVNHKKIRDRFKPLAPIADLRHPRRFFIVQHVERSLNRNRLQCIRLNRQRRIGLGGSSLVVVVFQRNPRQQFMRFIQLRIGLQRLLRRILRLGIKPVCTQLSHPQHRARLLGIYRQSFLVKLPCFLRIESLLKQLAPAHFVIGVLRMSGSQRLKFIVRTREILRAPQQIRMIQSLRGTCGNEHCAHQRQVQGPHHLSIDSCSRESSINRAVNCFLYSSGAISDF